MGMGNKRFIKYKELLYYYDLPLIFCAKDNLDCNYLCLLVNEDDSKYLCVEISKEILENFKSGLCDLASIYKNDKNKKYYICIIEDTVREPLELYKEKIPKSWINMEGFFLRNNCSPQDERAIKGDWETIGNDILFAANTARN